MERVNCDFCGSSDSHLWASSSGIDVVKCRKCGLMYSNPRLTKEELDEFYKSEYFKEGGNYTEDQLRMKQYQVDIDDLHKTCGTKGKILDVGCAIGLFLRALPDTWEKYGIDGSRSAASLGRDKYQLNLFSGELPSVDFFKPDFFVVIIMRGTLEHLPSPKQYMKKVYELLKDGGTFVISTLPNLDSIAAKLFKKDFRLLLPKQHLYHFTTKTVNNYLEDQGFEIVRYYYPYLETPYAHLCKDVCSLFTNKILSRQSPPFFKSTMTVYAKKRKNKR